jgi:putative ABC transport system permease protein
MVQLALAVLSLWGLVSYAVERRTAEMGLRLALGATPRDLVRLMMRPALLLILAGVALGSIAGIVGSQVMLSTSVGLAPPDLVAIVPVTIAFTATAMLSAWWPARRAGMADPAASLRRE